MVMLSSEATALLMKTWGQAYFQSPNKMNAIKFDGWELKSLKGFYPWIWSKVGIKCAKDESQFER